MNELNSMVEERLAERDQQISSTAEKVKQLCEVINKKDIEISKLKVAEKNTTNELQGIFLLIKCFKKQIFQKSIFGKQFCCKYVY